MKLRKKLLSAGFLGVSVIAISSCGSGENSQEPTSVALEATPQAENTKSVAPLKDSPRLPNEELLVTEALDNVNAGWVFAHDLNFNTLTSGRIQVMDVLSENRNFRGQINAAQFAAFNQSASRSEVYVAETYYSRGVRGERTDLVAVYDLNTLDLKEEIILPKKNRALNVTQKGNFEISGDENFAFVFTFTPASGVAVIDLNARSVVNEISVPGCTMAYAYGDRSFAMLCGDGGMVAFTLNERGEVQAELETDVFHDIDEHPMFMKYGRIGDKMHWPTFTGRLQSIDFSSGAPVPGELWDFVGDEDYLPSGWQVISASPTGSVFVLMRAGAGVGDHKFGGDVVWELDPTSKEILRKIKLETPVLSIELLKTEQPIMAVTAEDMSLDVYDLTTGERIRSIGGFMSSTPFVLHASEFGR